MTTHTDLAAANAELTDLLYRTTTRHATELEAALSERDALKAELAELKKQVYVPGAWNCAKCDLRITCTVLSALDGGMSADDSPGQCPNGCGPLWRVTERADRQEAQRSFNKQFDELVRTAQRGEGEGDGGNCQIASSVFRKITVTEMQQRELIELLGTTLRGLTGAAQKASAGRDIVLAAAIEVSKQVVAKYDSFVAQQATEGADSVEYVEDSDGEIRCPSCGRLAGDGHTKQCEAAPSTTESPAANAYPRDLLSDWSEEAQLIGKRAYLLDVAIREHAARARRWKRGMH